MTRDNDNNGIKESSNNNDFKDNARDSRIGKLRKTNEEVLRKKLQEEAKTQCKDYYHSLGQCARDTGLLSAFKCRRQTWELSNCLDQYYNEEVFLKYLQDRNLPAPQKSKSLMDSINNFKIFK